MRILILNQAFYPDVVATAQYGSELGQALAEAGHEVYALAASRGYDDPKKMFPTREVWQGIQIIRVPSLGLGKGGKLRRALEFAWFMTACSVRIVFMPKFDVIVSLTSPPIISYLASWIKVLRGSKLVYWTMDLNPDEAIAAGWLRENSITAKGLIAAQAFSIRKSDKVIVLDRFMQERVRTSSSTASIVVIPPWPHDWVAYDKKGRESFRYQHGLTDKFVIMYSGNHSPCHPLDVLLESAQELQHEDNFVFAFVGGGSEFSKVKKFASDRGLRNIITLPYQPKEQLSSSLSAADLHVVVMGNPFVGIIHPCKVYNILALGAPFLYIGPGESHVTDLVSSLGVPANCVASVRHGDVAGAVRAIRNARSGAKYGPCTSQDMPGNRKMLDTFIASIESLAS
jgi:colanic acid biosynthesis glycosyl transferase WcaI